MQLVVRLNSKFESQLCHVTFMDIDQEIISAVILPLPLIEEGHCPVTGESMCTKYRLNTFFFFI